MLNPDEVASNLDLEESDRNSVPSGKIEGQRIFVCHKLTISNHCKSLSIEASIGMALKPG